MTSVEGLYEKLLTGRNSHVTNKKENVERVVNGFTMVDPNFSNHADYQRGIALAENARALYEAGNYAAAAKEYVRSLRHLTQFEIRTFQKIPMKIPMSKKVTNALARIQAAAPAPAPAAAGALLPANLFNFGSVPNARGGKRTRRSKGNRKHRGRSRKH
jgi:hypothetical protein